MKRKTLVAAREKKGWNQQLLADHLFPQVSKTTVSNWECALKTPRPHYKGELCRVLGFDDPEMLLKIDTADEDANEGHQDALAEDSLEAFHEIRMTDSEASLAVEETTSSDQSPLNTITRVSVPSSTSSLMRPYAPTLHHFIVSDPARHFWQIAHTDYSTPNEMTAVIQAAIKDMNMTTGDNITRRDALCELASIPLISLGRNAELKPSKHEELLRFCTAALEGCWELSRYNDLQAKRYAYQCVSAYIPLLETIARDSNQYRKRALDLAARYALLKTLLSWTGHVALTADSIGYAQYAAMLSKETGNISLLTSACTKLTWSYLRNKNYAMGLKTIQEGEQVIKSYQQRKKGPALPPGMLGNFNSSYALARVYNGLNPDAAIGAALDSEPLGEYVAFVEFTEADQHYEAAKIYTLNHNPVQAMEQLGKLINTDTLAFLSGVDLTEGVRLHIANHLTSALLQLSEKDMGQIAGAWETAMQGAQERHNEVIYSEALENFAIMRALWGHEDVIRRLMPLTSHW